MKSIFLSCVLATLALGVASQNNKPLEWWQQSVIYQIYPRSFQDTDGDGVGDLNGITSKLDYLRGIGIDAVWISPIYESPMKDFGYDISNFTNIDPLFGTLDDFDRMAEEFHKRDMKLIMDMVPNHSSDLHEWFQKSIDRIDPYTNYYVWKDPKGYDANGKPIPPNNWVSVFGGSAWEWNEKRQQFYLHQFVKEQPDLDYENIQVRNEILAVVKFWLDRGVDGFRVDAVLWIYEDQRFLDEPENPNRQNDSTPSMYDYYDHIYTHNLPQVPEFLATMRQLMDVYTVSDGHVRCMMVEAWVSGDYIPVYYGTPDKPVSHFPFNFRSFDVRPDSNATEVLQLVNEWNQYKPDYAWSTFLLGNHDQKRFPTRWGNDSLDGPNMINLLLQGTAVTYQGEEIGMTDTFLTWEETQDPQACNQDPARYLEFSRDPSRTPFHWSSAPGAGFSTSEKTWLPINPNYVSVNVAAEEAAEESHLKVYKELMKVRDTDTWRYGSYESKPLGNDKVVGFARNPPRGSTNRGFLVLVNVSEDDVTVDATVFDKVPLLGVVRTRSVGFKNSGSVIGGTIDTRSVALGPKNAIVIEYNALS